VHLQTLSQAKRKRFHDVSRFLGSPTPIQWFHPWSQGRWADDCNNHGPYMSIQYETTRLAWSQVQSCESCKEQIRAETCKNGLAWFGTFHILHPKSSLVSLESNLAMIAAQSSWRQYSEQRNGNTAMDGCQISSEEAILSISRVASPALPARNFRI
jgi:hypothetical protein